METQKSEIEVVDDLDQFIMSLKWEEEYTNEYQRRVVINAIKFVYSNWQTGRL